MTTLEISRHYRPVLLLTSSIPNIQFSRPLVQLYILHLEINGSHLGIFLGQEIALGETPEQGRLADIAVSDDDYLVFLLVFVYG